MTPIEIIALILIIISAVKIVVLIVKPKAWMNFAKKIYSKPKATKVISLILAIVVLYYLLNAGITIVQVFAVTTFVVLLLVIGLASEASYIIKKYEAQIKKGHLWKDYWFYTIMWIILLIWGAKELLM